MVLLVSGATDSIYTTPATVLADNGSLFSVKVQIFMEVIQVHAANLYVTALGSQSN